MEAQERLDSSSPDLQSRQGSRPTHRSQQRDTWTGRRRTPALPDRLRAKSLQRRSPRGRSVNRRAGPRGDYLRPVLPAGRLRAAAVSDVVLEWRQGLGATAMPVALAWLLRRSPNLVLIPGTSSLAHLRENLAAAGLDLTGDVLGELDGLTQPPPVICMSQYLATSPSEAVMDSIPM